MKILFLSYEFPPAGGEAGETCLALLREYSKNPEIQVDLVTSSVDEKYHTLKMGDNINIHRIPISKNPNKIASRIEKQPISFAWKAYRYSRKLAKQSGYDLAHVFFSGNYGIIAPLLKFEFKLPYMLSLHGSDHDGYKRGKKTSYELEKKIAKKILSRSSFVIANSQWLKELAISTDPKKEIDVIHNGVDTANFFPDASKRNPEQFKIICVSQLVPIKGVRFLIQAFKLLSVRYAQVLLLIVGDGNEKQSLEDLARAVEIKDRVEFVGASAFEKIPEYYQKGNLFVSPSLEDGVSKVILEAMACGLPVVAAETRLTSEIVKDNSNGMLVKKNDPDDLAEKIEKLISDKRLLKTMAKNSLARANELSWENVAKKYLEFYAKTRNISHVQD